jgi:hypothetical protein
VVVTNLNISLAFYPLNVEYRFHAKVYAKKTFAWNGFFQKAKVLVCLMQKFLRAKTLHRSVDSI